MVWNIGMQGEKDGKKLFTEGEQLAEILEVKHITQEESKSGNPYFWWKLLTKEGEIEVRTTLLKGKRWLLKQMLSACGIEAKSDDPEQKYSFEEKDVVGKTIVITITNKDNTFTGRTGNLVTFKKSEVTRIQKYQKEETKETL